MDRLDRFSLGPSPGGPVESPWYALRNDNQIGIFISGPPGSSNALSLEWGTKTPGAIESLGRDRIVVDDRPHDERLSAWRFVLASELPQPPAGADAVRVVFENLISRGSAVGVSAPVTYSSETLTKQIGDRGSSRSSTQLSCRTFPARDSRRFAGESLRRRTRY